MWCCSRHSRRRAKNIPVRGVDWAGWGHKFGSTLMQAFSGPGWAAGPGWGGVMTVVGDGRQNFGLACLMTQFALDMDLVEDGCAHSGSGWREGGREGGM